MPTQIERASAGDIVGARQLLEDYLAVGSDDQVLIAHTADAVTAASVVGSELAAQGIAYRVVEMQPLEDDRIAATLTEAISSVPIDAALHVVTFEAHTMSHGPALRSCLEAWGGRWRAVRCTSVGEGFFDQALGVDVATLEDRNTALLSHLGTADEVRVTAPGGTDFVATLAPTRFRWISNNGRPIDEKFVVLPAGEVATYPVSVTGTLVADLAVHANVPIERDTRLHHAPLTVELVDGDAVELRCDDHDMLTMVAGWFREPWGTRVGELGFGTNLGVVASVATNSHVNERSPGVHLGFGHHHQGRDRVGYDTDIHVDLIAQGGIVEVGGYRLDLTGPLTALADFSTADLAIDAEDIISTRPT